MRFLMEEGFDFWSSPSSSISSKQVVNRTACSTSTAPCRSSFFASGSLRPALDEELRPRASSSCNRIHLSSTAGKNGDGDLRTSHNFHRTRDNFSSFFSQTESQVGNTNHHAESTETSALSASPRVLVQKRARATDFLFTDKPRQDEHHHLTTWERKGKCRRVGSTSSRKSWNNVLRLRLSLSQSAQFQGRGHTHFAALSNATSDLLPKPGGTLPDTSGQLIEKPGPPGAAPPGKKLKGTMLYGFNTIKKLVGKGKRFAGMAIGKVFKVITIMRQVLRRVLKPAKAGAYVVGTGLQKTKDKFQVFWYSFLLPKLIATLDSAAADGAALTSPGNLVRIFANEDFMGSQERIGLAVTHASAGMRHSKKAILLLQDVLKRTAEIQQEANEILVQTRYLAENPKALCNGLEEQEPAGSDAFLPLDTMRIVEEDPSASMF